LNASGARPLSRSIIDISIGCSRISGTSPARSGETIRVFFAGLEMNATIERIDADDFAVAFESTFTNQAAMIRRIHSGR
jgi:hypothetical protein